ncbi:hypothetical protein [Pedobacter rhodius]|uniref:Uncharacterized protein n=1 Tax=Pedobacter rhodius TaxID=3004098 RepID=A0ABT4L0R5_9SPHI|nr:hypothetical protein [Pedobacter sp. SJ11]MCZ4224042.1 hypothetical protein [Pedobacter sp. SJ11]
MDFTKAENKICRAIFEIGLQREFKKGMNEFAAIIDKWKSEKPEDNRESYYSIFTAVKDFDKHIAHRYDGLKNSWFYGTIVALLIDKVITAEDLKDFSEERKAELLLAVERNTKSR